MPTPKPVNPTHPPSHTPLVCACLRVSTHNSLAVYVTHIFVAARSFAQGTHRAQNALRVKCAVVPRRSGFVD
jgi:hypothetical protein